MASGDTLVVFTPLHNQPPASGFATPDTRNDIPVLDFADGATESAEFAGVMPRNYGGGGVTATVGWMATDTTVGPDDAVIGLAFKSVTDNVDDLDTKAYAANNQVTSEEAAGGSGRVKYQEITFTDGADMDSVAAGEYFHLRFQRLGADGSDDLADDLEFVFVELKET